MNDTHPESKGPQQKIYLNIINSDRFRIACEMSDALFLFAESDIKNKFPEINALDLKVETFKRMYKHDYTPEY